MPSLWLTRRPTTSSEIVPDLQWAIAVWERKLRRFFGGRPGLQSRGDVAMNEEEFKRLASQALDSMSREAVEEAVKDKDLLDDEVFEDAPEQFQSSHRREPSIVGSLAMLLKGWRAQPPAVKGRGSERGEQGRPPQEKQQLDQRKQRRDSGPPEPPEQPEQRH